MDNTENIEEIKKLFKECGMAYKGDLIESLSEEEFRKSNSYQSATQLLWCFSLGL